MVLVAGLLCAYVIAILQYLDQNRNRQCSFCVMLSTQDVLADLICIPSAESSTQAYV